MSDSSRGTSGAVGRDVDASMLYIKTTVYAIREINTSLARSDVIRTRELETELIPIVEFVVDKIAEDHEEKFRGISTLERDMVEILSNFSSLKNRSSRITSMIRYISENIGDYLKLR